MTVTNNTKIERIPIETMGEPTTEIGICLRGICGKLNELIDAHNTSEKQE